MCGKGSSLSETMSSLWETVSSTCRVVWGLLGNLRKVTRMGSKGREARAVPGPEFRVVGTPGYSWVPGESGTPANQQANSATVDLSICSGLCDNQVRSLLGEGHRHAISIITVFSMQWYE